MYITFKRAMEVPPNLGHSVVLTKHERKHHLPQLLMLLDWRKAMSILEGKGTF